LGFRLHNHIIYVLDRPRFLVHLLLLEGLLKRQLIIMRITLNSKRLFRLRVLFNFWFWSLASPSVRLLVVILLLILLASKRLQYLLGGPHIFIIIFAFDLIFLDLRLSIVLLLLLGFKLLGHLADPWDMLLVIMGFQRPLFLFFVWLLQGPLIIQWPLRFLIQQLVVIVAVATVERLVRLAFLLHTACEVKTLSCCGIFVRRGRWLRRLVVEVNHLWLLVHCFLNLRLLLRLNLIQQLGCTLESLTVERWLHGWRRLYLLHHLLLVD